MTDISETGKSKNGLKVIGAGFGRTGTLSLKAALEELGFAPCYHMTEVFARPQDVKLWIAATRGEDVHWQDIFAEYQATVDWPGCTFYEELMNIYPNAKVLLTVRDPNNWYESVISTIYRVSRMSTTFSFRVLSTIIRGPSSDRMRAIPLINALVWEQTFGNDFENKEHAIAIFNQHIEAVKQRVPAEKLLVYNVKEGWEPLCRFLGVEIPTDKPFPHLNDRTNFAGGNRAWQAARQRLSRALLVVGALVVILLLLRTWKRN
jgi:hypothetical protein